MTLIFRHAHPVFSVSKALLSTSHHTKKKKKKVYFESKSHGFGEQSNHTLGLGYVWPKYDSRCQCWWGGSNSGFTSYLVVMAVLPVSDIQCRSRIIIIIDAVFVYILLS